MPIAPESPTEGGASIKIPTPPQPLEMLMSQGNLDAFQSHVEIGNTSISLNSGGNAGNWNQEPPPDLIMEEESIFCDFIWVSSLDNVDICKLGLPPLSHLMRGVIFALVQTCENRLPNECGVKSMAAKQVLVALQSASAGFSSLSE
jgi:hypothetical protein